MKSLLKYLSEKLVIIPSQVNEKLVIIPSQVNEKLVINKDYKIDDLELVQSILDKLIDKKSLSSRHMSSIANMKNDLSVNLADNGEFHDFKDQMKVKICNDIFESMSSMNIYRFIHGEYGHDWKIDLMYEKFEKNNIEFEEILWDPLSDYVVDYLDCEKIKIFHFGRKHYQYTFIATER